MRLPRRTAPKLFSCWSSRDRSRSFDISSLASLGVHFGHNERQQSHLACEFDRLGDLSLLLGSRTRLSARHHFAAIVDELPQKGSVLVVNDVNLVGSQIADLALARFARASGSIRILVLYGSEAGF